MNPHGEAVDELTAELEAACVRELANEWGELNRTLFQGRLRRPALLLDRGQARLGYWDRATRTLAISTRCALDHTWPVVLDVLKHEMAHQYIDEIEGVFGETSHGPRFRALCSRLGIDPRASGLRSAPEGDECRVIDKVARLLALATSASPHEAEAAMTAARRLMLKHNVETPAGDRRYATRLLGEAKQRVDSTARSVSWLLGEHFFVQVIWISVYEPRTGKHGKVLEISGTEANLDMAEYAYHFTHRAAHEAWAAHKRETKLTGNGERRSFLSGVVTGFGRRLTRDAKRAASEGLVWVGDADLKRFFRDRYPRITFARTGASLGARAFAAGSARGETLVLHRPIHAAATHRGRLLAPHSAG